MTEFSANTGAVSGPRLVLRATLRSDVGKVRAENQDFALLTSPEEERGSRLLVVADGMGGHRGGATASRLAGETVKQMYLAATTEDIAAALRQALVTANSKIFAEAQSNPDLRGMGTTTSALVVRDGVGWFAHVGDSRIYLIRKGEIRQLTDDHSLVASMVREGLLTSQEAENHPRRNVLQRSMGVGEDVEIDVRGPLALEEGDCFVLCSDGLHGVVKEDEIKEVAKLSVDAAADEFVKRALERGAPDNVTVIVARVERELDSDATVIESEAGLFEETIRETATARATPLGERTPKIASASTASPSTGSPSTAPQSATPPRPVPTVAPPQQEHVEQRNAAVQSVEPPAPPVMAAIQPEGRRSISLLKWTILFVAVLVAAGALFLSR